MKEASSVEFHKKKRYGQNFLTDRNILKSIAETAEIESDDVVLEIGPGQGTLTRELLSRAGFVHAVEVDTELSPWLSHIEDEYGGSFAVHFGDAVQFDYSKLEPFPSKVVANIPYNITTPLICALLPYAERGLRRHVYTVQREAAERILAAADTKERYPLGVTVEAMGCARIVRGVPRGAFSPVPNVDSCVIDIRLERNFELGSDLRWNEFLHTGFRQRRKMLVNNLKNLNGGCKSVAEWLILLEECGINTKIRAEDLTAAEWQMLYSRVCTDCGRP